MLSATKVLTLGSWWPMAQRNTQHLTVAATPEVAKNDEFQALLDQPLQLADVGAAKPRGIDTEVFTAIVVSEVHQSLLVEILVDIYVELLLEPKHRKGCPVCGGNHWPYDE